MSYFDGFLQLFRLSFCCGVILNTFRGVSTIFVSPVKQKRNIGIAFPASSWSAAAVLAALTFVEFSISRITDNKICRVFWFSSVSQELKARVVKLGTSIHLITES